MRHLSILIIISFGQLLFSCKNQPTIKVKDIELENVKDTNQKEPVPPPAPQKDILGESFNNKKEFQILWLIKGISSASTDDDTAKCTKWLVTKNDLHKIVHNSKPISGTELDLAYENLKCIIKAELAQNGKKFDLELNSGSWMYIRCRDTTLILGNDTKSDRKHFLSHSSSE